MTVRRGPAVPHGPAPARRATASNGSPYCASASRQAARDVRTAEDWARRLRTAARLPAETWANILLISSRRPDATLVKGYEAWRAAGRQVNRNEKGIEIFSGPRQQKGNRRYAAGRRARPQLARRGPRRHTSGICPRPAGQPLPARGRDPARRPGEVPPGLWDGLWWLARREGFAVEREPGCPADGTTLWTARRIRVPPGLAGGQAIWALAHQLGHVLLHDPTATVPGTTTTGCSGRAQGRSRLRRVHHLHPARHPDRARLRQPADLGRHRPARPARLPPSWPPANASPSRRRESAATWTTTCPAAPAGLPAPARAETAPR